MQALKDGRLPLDSLLAFPIGWNHFLSQPQNSTRSPLRSNGVEGLNTRVVGSSTPSPLTFESQGSFSSTSSAASSSPPPTPTNHFDFSNNFDLNSDFGMSSGYSTETKYYCSLSEVEAPQAPMIQTIPLPQAEFSSIPQSQPQLQSSSRKQSSHRRKRSACDSKPDYFCFVNPL